MRILLQLDFQGENLGSGPGAWLMRQERAVGSLVGAQPLNLKSGHNFKVKPEESGLLGCRLKSVGCEGLGVQIGTKKVYSSPPLHITDKPY